MNVVTLPASHPESFPNPIEAAVQHAALGTAGIAVVLGEGDRFHNPELAANLQSHVDAQLASLAHEQEYKGVWVASPQPGTDAIDTSVSTEDAGNVAETISTPADVTSLPKPGIDRTLFDDADFPPTSVSRFNS